jgi:hypothetical protein
MEDNIFYSKVCVAGSIKFAVEQLSKVDLKLNDSQKVSCFFNNDTSERQRSCSGKRGTYDTQV